MPVFDPNRPADHAPLSAQEMRDQLNALKAQVDDAQAQVSALLGSLSAVQRLTQAISDPPTQLELTQVQEKVNELIIVLGGT